MERKLHIEGMSCMHCVGRVKKYLETVASNVSVDLDAKQAVFQADDGFDMDTAIESINAFGFTATPE